MGGHQPTPGDDNEPSACRAPQKGLGSFLDDGSAWIIIIIINNNTNHTDTLHASCTTWPGREMSFRESRASIYEIPTKMFLFLYFIRE